MQLIAQWAGLCFDGSWSLKSFSFVIHVVGMVVHIPFGFTEFIDGHLRPGHQQAKL